MYVQVDFKPIGGTFCFCWIDDTWATPKTPATPVTKNISPTYSLEIQGWNVSWLELLEWLEEGGSLQPATPTN